MQVGDRKRYITGACRQRGRRRYRLVRWTAPHSRRKPSRRTERSASDEWAATAARRSTSGETSPTEISAPYLRRPPAIDRSDSWEIYRNLHSDCETIRIPRIQPMRSVASGSAQQVAISSSCHIVAPFSAVGRLLLQARLPGTRCQTIFVIRRLAKTLLGDYWRHTCLRCTSARSVRGVCVMRSINFLLTYLLTLLCRKGRLRGRQGRMASYAGRRRRMGRDWGTLCYYNHGRPA